MEESKCYVYASFDVNRRQCENVENEGTKLFLLGNEPNITHCIQAMELEDAQLSNSTIIQTVAMKS